MSGTERLGTGHWGGYLNALSLSYRQPAEDSASGWERESLPLGNGFLGANVFGGVACERIQITEGTLWNPIALGGLNNAAELYLRFTHGETAETYERGLSLDDAVASCRYAVDGVTYTREAFASYPDRVLGDPADADVPTDERLRRYAAGASDPGLEALYFQFGRYLLIASSRPGGLPAGLQGIWNCHDQPPWAADYHFNVNIQMNYYPAFSANLAETFQPLADYLAAIRPAAETLAPGYIREHNPDLANEWPGACGWTVGTACSPLEISAPSCHSGPGTGGLTTKLLWDWYDFTRDEAVLREQVYPALAGMSRFLTKTVRDYDGKYLTSWSASPEQMTGGKWPRVWPYHTVGCAFDQQMIHENGGDLLRAAALLGTEDETVREQRRQVGRYQPVEVGWSGQVKEFSEEKFYGEIGEYRHRHLAQLTGLHPGASISRDTPAWLDAAKVTLDERGDDAGSGGWALAMRLNCRARTGEGDRAHRLLRNLIGSRTFPNLWVALRGPWDVKTFAMDEPYLFQIDGNLGGTAGIAEMLLQSHETHIRVLPARPEAWSTGRFRGLVARGNFVIDAEWRDGVVKRIGVLARKGGRLRIACRGFSGARVTDGQGRLVTCEIEGEDRMSFETEVGGQYTIEGMRSDQPVPAPRKLTGSRPDVRLCWEGVEGCRYNVYRSVDGAPAYETLATGFKACEYRDADLDFDFCEIVTYKVTACRSDGGGESDGPTVTLNHASALDIDRYRHRVRQQNLDG